MQQDIPTFFMAVVCEASVAGYSQPKDVREYIKRWYGYRYGLRDETICAAQRAIAALPADVRTGLISDCQFNYDWKFRRPG